jgi:Ca-activated chloride channel family protein
VLELANPELLLILPLPIVIIKFFQKSNVKNQIIGLNLPFIKQLESVINKNQIIVKQTWAKFLLLYLWILTTVAISGPRWVGEPIVEQQLAHQLMLVLDLSPSMGIVDRTIGNRPVNRLTLVKQTALDFLEKRTQDRIGLILFGSKAFLQTPLTYDHQHLAERLQQASVGLLGQSTAIGDALGLAIKHMGNKKGDKIIVLLTDGANNAGVMPPTKAAELANDHNIKLYIIGLDQAPAAQGFGGFFAMQAGSDLDEETLKSMANIAHGQYFRSTDLKSLALAYQEIDKLAAVKTDAPILRPQIFYYHWILALLIVGFIITVASRIILNREVPQ